MKKTLFSIALYAALCSAALAQTTPTAPPGDSTYPGTATPGTARPTAVSFDSLDKNRDAKISKDEAQGSVAVVAAFDTADKNDDGTLSKTEFDAYFNKR